MPNRPISQLKVEMGQRLKLARLALGLSAEELAARLKYGVTKQKISNYELGDNAPPHAFLARLHAELGITADWIVSGDRSTLPGRIASRLPDGE